MLHEALVELFRNRPELAPELLQALGLELPRYTEVRTDTATITDVGPAELRADLVILLVDGKPVLGIIVEAQLTTDSRKRYVWPAYAVGLRARLECPCVVLVVTVDDAVANWAARPIDLGFGSVFKPLVVGPRGVPIIRDPSASPEVAVLSAMAHGHDDVDTAVAVALAAAGACAPLDPERRMLYSDLVLAALSEAARKAFEMLPQGYQFQSETLRRSFERGKVDGRTEGTAQTVLDVLDARGIAVTEDVRGRILACTDLDRLRVWARRVATVESAETLLES